MAQATITLTGEGVQEIQQLDMQISVIATININAVTAKRKVTAWLVSEVANLLVGGTPQLVIGQQSVWRVPVLLTSSQVGQVGQVGAVDVDTVSGQLFINSDLKKQIIANAKRAARSVSTTVG
ncbi:MAG: hypothetical protein DCC55_15980 [Chloroflexi bacterium]|nr:MAG: hypothetical protein DCC55_15980 [Chloroflexota bacterium]